MPWNLKQKTATPWAGRTSRRGQGEQKACMGHLHTAHPPFQPWHLEGWACLFFLDARHEEATAVMTYDRIIHYQSHL